MKAVRETFEDILHDGVDSCELLEECNSCGDDQVRPVAGLEELLHGVLHEGVLSGVEQDVLKLHLHVFLATDLLQNLHAATVSQPQ